MKNPKAKGGAFERKVSEQLSLWITDGKRKDVFWRSAMSGGRATVARGEVRQAGDICAVSPEGHAFCNRFFIECKHLKTCDLDAALSGRGDLVRIWKKLCDQAYDHKKHPVLILKRNNRPTLLINSWNSDMFNAPYRAVIYWGLTPMCVFFFEADILKSKVPSIFIKENEHGRAPMRRSTPVGKS